MGNYWNENLLSRRAPASGLLRHFVFGSLALRAAGNIAAARIREIAAMLPAQPAGFAWPITNRAAWQKLAPTPRFSDVISARPKLLAKPLPEQPDSLFLEYSQTGNRTHWQKVAGARRGRIAHFHPGRGVGK